MAMHDHSHVEATITVVGADTEEQAYVGCFGRSVDEKPADTEARWNQFAKTMWEWGLEPMEDDPHFTFVGNDGLIFDHYQLRPVREDGCKFDAGIIRWAIAAAMMVATSAQFSQRVDMLMGVFPTHIS